MAHAEQLPLQLVGFSNQRTKLFVTMVKRLKLLFNYIVVIDNNYGDNDKN
jgi:hypothetical protein